METIQDLTAGMKGSTDVISSSIPPIYNRGHMIPMGVYPDPDINDDVNSASWLGDGVSISTEPANKSCIQSAAVKNLDNAGFKPLCFFVCVCVSFADHEPQLLFSYSVEKWNCRKVKTMHYDSLMIGRLYSLWLTSPSLFSMFIS